MTEIDLKTTLEHTRGRISVPHIARQTTRDVSTVRKWMNGGKIPDTVVPRLLEIFEFNEVKIYYK